MSENVGIKYLLFLIGLIGASMTATPFKAMEILKSATLLVDFIVFITFIRCQQIFRICYSGRCSVQQEFFVFIRLELAYGVK